MIFVCPQVNASITVQRPVSHQRTLKYRITDIGALGGDDSHATGINDKGAVVGYANLVPKGEQTHAILWERGHLQDLDRQRPTDNSEVLSVNGSGVCVGSTFSLAPPRVELHACLWHGPVRQDLGELGTLGHFSMALHVNGSGDACGYATTQFGHVHASVWRDGKMIDIADPATTRSGASCINDRGVVAGWESTPTGSNAAVWTKGKTTILPDLPGGTYSQALYINNAGQIVGNGNTAATKSVACLWTSAKRVAALGTLGGPESMAIGINDRGQIVGGADTAHQDHHAFLWQHGVMVDLNSLVSPHSGWVLRVASAINNRGQIAGMGIIKGKKHGFLLTPEP